MTETTRHAGGAVDDALRCVDCGHAPGCDCTHDCTLPHERAYDDAFATWRDVKCHTNPHEITANAVALVERLAKQARIDLATVTGKPFTGSVHDLSGVTEVTATLAVAPRDVQPLAYALASHALIPACEQTPQRPHDVAAFVRQCQQCAGYLAAVREFEAMAGILLRSAQTVQAARLAIATTPPCIGVEAYCATCDGSFNPTSDADLIHFMTDDETYCGGRGQIVGWWG